MLCLIYCHTPDLASSNHYLFKPPDNLAVHLFESSEDVKCWLLQHNKYEPKSIERGISNLFKLSQSIITDLTALCISSETVFLLLYEIRRYLPNDLPN